MDHPRVVTGLVGAGALLPLEDADAPAGLAEGQLAGHREAEDAPADHGDVASFGHESLGYATSMPSLEIVIVSSTGAGDLLRDCLRSLREHPYTGGEMLVHVVDNASADGTPEMVRDEFPEVRLHALDWNSGFCIANNIALRELESPYVLVLNPDTEIYPGSLDHMMA